MRLTDTDRARVAEAIRTAERSTDAEIVAITAAQSDSYADVALQWSVLGLLLLIALQAAMPGHFIPALDLLAGRTGYYGPAWTLTELLNALMLLLAAAFVLLMFLTRSLPVRMALAPRGTKTRRVRRRAVLLFRAAVEARTASHTGALIYVSLAERRAEIVTDAAVVAKVPADRWRDAMAALVAAMREGRPADGIVAAIETVGAVLAEHFPFTGTDPNELPDGLVEL